MECSVQSTREEMSPKMVSKPCRRNQWMFTIQDPVCQLYDILIKPVGYLIQGNKLLIISEDVLYPLPFSALLDGQGTFLTKTFTTQVCTSLETLALISKRPKREFEGSSFVTGNPLVGRVRCMERSQAQ